MHHEQAGQSDISIDMRFLQWDDEHEASREFTLRIPLLCVLGLAFYFGWIFCLFWSPVLLPSAAVGDFEAHAIRTVMTVAMFVAYVAFGLFARFFASRRGELLLRLTSLLCCPFGCAVAVLPPAGDLALPALLWCASGVGSSALLLVWSKKLVILNR